MPPRPPDCDPDRLRRLLDDRLDEADQAAMADHLAACEPCRRTLDHMAAGTLWWREARALLAPEEPPGHDATEAIYPADRHEPGRDAVDFLAPSDDPAHLGRIGPYEVVEVIGRGGMGVVLKGLDPSLNRFVAIKVLAPELATSASARRRFAREGQAAAAICHDHVVAIHAVDASGGLPYLVMQYVAGKSLQERIDQTGPLPVEEIVRIGMQAARGLAAAHGVGLIHRDVKPSNILLENGVERVKLVDFGLARAADDASLTQSGVVAGTPQYMSPEQAGGEPVDHRADLFSLGSVLYALCTGRPPFRAETTMAVLRRVSDDTPRPIRELNPEVPDWLEAIVMKLHAKDPADRFQTASEVALLLGRCLAYLREPKRGKPPYEADLPEPPPPRKRRLAIAAVALLALVGLGAAGSEFVATILRIRTAEGTMVIKVSDPDVKVKVDGEDVVITGAGPQELRVKPGLHTIESAKAGRVETRIVTVERGGKQAVEVGFEADEADRIEAVIPRPTDADRSLVVSLGANGDGSLGPIALNRLPVADLATLARQVKAALDSPVPSHDRLLIRVAPGLDHAEVLKVSKLLQDSKAPTITVLGPVRDPAAPSRPETHASRATVTHNGRPIDAKVEFTPATPPGDLAFPSLPRTDARIARGADQPAPSRAPRVPAVAPSREGRVAIVRPGAAAGEVESRPARVHAIAFAPDGRRLAVASGVPARAGANPVEDAGLACVGEFDGNTFRIRSAANSAKPFRAVAFAPDGKTFAAGGVVEPSKEPGGEPRVYETARIFDAEAGKPIRGFKHFDDVNAVAFSPEGQFLVTGCEDGHIAAFEVDSGRSLGSGIPNGRLGGANFPVIGVVIAPDGRSLFAWTRDGSAGLWTLSRSQGLQPDYRLQINDRSIACAAYSPDGATLATGARDGTIVLWDVRTGKVKAELPKRDAGAVTALAFSPNGFLLASAGSVGVAAGPGRGLFAIRLRNAVSHEVIADLEGPTHTISSVAFAPDGKSLAAGSIDGTIRLWDVPMSPAEVDPVRASPLRPMTGRTTARAAAPGTLPALPGGAEPPGLPVLPSPDRPGADPFIPPEPSRDALHPVSPRHAPEAQPSLPGGGAANPFEPMPSRPQPAGGLAIGRRALPEGARPEGEADGSAVLALALAPDGKTCATGSEDGVVRVLDVATRRVVRELRGHTAPVRSLFYTTNGDGICSAASDPAREQAGEILTWDLRTGHDGPAMTGVPPYPLALATAPGGKALAIGFADGTLRFLRKGSATPTTLRSLGKPIRALAVAPDGATLAWAGGDGTIEVWKVADATGIQTLPGTGTSIVALATATSVRTLPGTGTPVVALAFAPGGKSLAAGGGRSVVLHDWAQADVKARALFEFRQCEVLAVAFSPDGTSLAAAGGNVAAKDGLSEVEVKIKQLEEARLEKAREVEMKREAIKTRQVKLGAMDLAQLKDRNTVSVEEYRALSNELTRIQAEIVKAEAQLAQLKKDQSAGVKRPRFTDRDVHPLFRSNDRVVAVQERYDRAKDRHESLKQKVRDPSDPSLQKSQKEMKEAQDELDALWKELRPEIEAAIRRDNDRPDDGLKAAEVQLAALKAQEASLADRLNALNVRQRDVGAAAIALEFDKTDLNRAETYLDTIERNLADLRLRVGDDSRPAEASRSLSELRVWDVASGRMTRAVVEPGGWIAALAFTRDGTALIAGGGTPGKPGSVTIFDLAPRPADAAPVSF